MDDVTKDELKKYWLGGGCVADRRSGNLATLRAKARETLVDIELTQRCFVNDDFANQVGLLDIRLYRTLSDPQITAAQKSLAAWRTRTVRTLANTPSRREFDRGFMKENLTIPGSLNWRERIEYAAALAECES